MTSNQDSNSISPDEEQKGRWERFREKPDKFLRSWFPIILIVVSIVFVIAIYWNGFGLVFFTSHFGSAGGEITVLDLNTIPEVLLTVLLISGVIVMVLSIGLLVVAYYIFNPKLITLKHSLGLPEGSVRSLVALMLIMLFSILSVHLYWKMAQTRPVSLVEVNYTDLPKSQMEALRQAAEPQNWISSSCSYQMADGSFQEVCNVVLLEVREERNTESERFAQQTLTTISTLVIALAGFYFGSRSVGVAGDLSLQSARRAEAGRKREQNTSS
jgi:hypothetical protein